MERKILFKCCECGAPIRECDIYYKLERKPYVIAVCMNCCKWEIAKDNLHTNFSDIANNLNQN